MTERGGFRSHLGPGFFPVFIRFSIVSGGDWLWNPANFKGWSLCSGFSLVTWSRRCTTIFSRWRPEYRGNRSSNQKFWFWLLNLQLIYRISSCQEINCVMFSCGTSRRTKGVGIWKLPNAKEDHQKWREYWLGEITKTREVDRDKCVYMREKLSFWRYRKM